MGTSKKASKKKLTPKQERFVEGVVRHKNATRAAREAGFSPKTARQQGSRLLTNVDILEAVEKRRNEATRRAQIHTDVIIGSLAEIATASLADVNPDDEFLRRAKELGTDHLIKKVKVNYDKLGAVTSREYEMYSRLDALNQLRDTFGMKEEPRPNTLNDRRRREAEAAVSRIMERDGLDRVTAATKLIDELRAIPNTRGLIEVVSALIN